MIFVKEACGSRRNSGEDIQKCLDDEMEWKTAIAVL